MRVRRLPLFDQAFGSDNDFWRAASLIRRFHGGAPPMLLVCSSRRIYACRQAEAFKAVLAKEKAIAQIAAEDLSHREINANLGLKGGYTDGVDAFLRSQGLL